MNGYTNYNGNIIVQNPQTNVNTNGLGGGGEEEGTRTSAPEPGTGSTMEEGAMCRPPELRDFVSSDTLQQIATMCQDPLILRNIVGVAPEITYNMKFEEYTFRGLVVNDLTTALDTIGIRDSDNDGLSDALELALGTDPFYWDTDRDSYTDGEEVLTYNTDALDPKSRTDGRSILITNIKDGMVTTDTRPVIAGIATPASLVEVRDGAGEETILLGTTRTDAKGKFLLVPTVEMAPGEHVVQASEVTEAGNVIMTSPSRRFIIDNMLDIPVPVITRIETKADCYTYVYGTSQVGTAVVGYFQSLLTVSSIVADSASGEFVVKSSTCLEPGEHTATLYATIPTGERSAAVQQPFTIVPEGSGAGWNFLPWLLGALMVLLLVYLSRRKRDMLLYVQREEEMERLKRAYAEHLEDAKARLAELSTGEPLTEEQVHEHRLMTSMDYTPHVPVRRKDLSARYLGFTTEEWHTADDGTRTLTAQVEMTGTIMAFELWTPGQEEPLTLLPGQVMPSKLRNTRVTYRFVPDPLPETPRNTTPYSAVKRDESRKYREKDTTEQEQHHAREKQE